MRVALKDLRKSFGAVEVVKGLDLEIAEGEFLVLLGPSGCGKTTALRMIAGLEPVTEGRILIGERDVTDVLPKYRDIAMVFQSYALYPHMTVAENIGYPLKLRKLPAVERDAAVREAAGKVHLGDYLARYPRQLSGGQRQRVALARALVIHPAVLLLDEPLGALDLHLRRRMQEELQHLQRRIGATFVHVTHDQEEAMNLADLVVVINHGRIEDLGDPRRVYLEPATRFTATFMGESNILEGRVVSAENGVAKVETALGPVLCSGTAETGARVEVCIRPEHLSPAVDAGPALTEARVTEAVFQGTRLRCHVLTEGRNEVELIASFAPDAGIGVGDRLRLSAKPENVIVLHA